MMTGFLLLGAGLLGVILVLSVIMHAMDDGWSRSYWDSLIGATQLVVAISVFMGSLILILSGIYYILTGLGVG